MPANKTKSAIHDAAAPTRKKQVAKINGRLRYETGGQGSKGNPAPRAQCYSPNRHLENKLNYFLTYT